MRKFLIFPAVALALTLTACGGQATEDRKGGAGNKPDSTKDTSKVELYRNADSIPNIAYFCAGDYGWASTLSGSDAGENKAATIVRFPDYDAVCTGEATEPVDPTR